VSHALAQSAFDYMFADDALSWKERRLFAIQYSFWGHHLDALVSPVLLLIAELSLCALYSQLLVICLVLRLS
jgi:hypothetical protein